MLSNILLAVTISLIMTGFVVFIVRPAWKAWDKFN
jgi:hypothetical protein